MQPRGFTVPLRDRIIGGLVLCTSLAWAEDYRLTQAGWTLRVDASGNMVALADQQGRQLIRSDLGDNRIRVALVPAGKSAADVADADLIPARRDDRPKSVLPGVDRLLFTYSLAPEMMLKLRYEIIFTRIGGFTTLQRQVTLEGISTTVQSDVLLVVGNNLTLPAEQHGVFVPRIDGLGERLETLPDRQWAWLLGGEPRRPAAVPNERLAVPVLSEWNGGTDLRLTHIADPFFTTGMRLADPARKRNGEFNCVYLGTKVPFSRSERRTFSTVLHEGGDETAMKAWYAIGLFGIPEGPDWLHDVAWQHYDYLSHGGKGWFEDIDALDKLIPRSDRSRILLTIHGWYDMLGRYTFNEKTRRLDDEWTAFPNAAKMKDKGFATLDSVRMSKTELHRRIRYAKDRGFRVCLYFADGMTACEGAADIYAPDEVLASGGWVGPDTVGKPYMQNPSHPRVYRRYLDYLTALMNEYGHDLDALVWDETFHVRWNAIGKQPKPDYAAVKMMTLARQCTQQVTLMQPQCALLASDDLGLTSDGKTYWTEMPPYAIVMHGTYQDSHAQPETWPYGLFPNLRNVLWSCNWQAVTHWDYTEFGMKHYDTPVATSNGYQDDKGIARLTPAQREALLVLFNERKGRRQQLRWLTGPPPVFMPASPQP